MGGMQVVKRGVLSGALALVAALTGLLIVLPAGASADPTPEQFNYTGAEQQWVVPLGVTLVSVQVVGAHGGAGVAGGGVGSGTPDEATGTLAVTPGETLYIEVGGHGQSANSATPACAPQTCVIAYGGFNGGQQAGQAFTSAPGVTFNGNSGGGGGGASDIRTIPIGASGSLASRLIVAGGAGGDGGVESPDSAPNGLGGSAGMAGTAGKDVASHSLGGQGAQPGTAVAAGAGGNGGAMGQSTADGYGPGGAGTAGAPGGRSNDVGGAGGPASVAAINPARGAGGGGGGGGGYYGGGGGGGGGGWVNVTNCCSTDAGSGGGGGGGSSYDPVGTISAASGVGADGLIVITQVEQVSPCPTIAISPSHLPDATSHSAYSQQITAAGGTAPYSFSPGQPLPTGLVLSGSGRLSGTPTVPAGSYPVSVMALDSVQCATSASYLLRVDPANVFTLGSGPSSGQGSLQLSLSLPGPGTLLASAAAAAAGTARAPHKGHIPSIVYGTARTTVRRAGHVSLKIKASPSARKVLLRVHRLRLRISVTFTPSGGFPHTQQILVTVR